MCGWWWYCGWVRSRYSGLFDRTCSRSAGRPGLTQSSITWSVGFSAVCVWCGEGFSPVREENPPQTARKPSTRTKRGAARGRCLRAHALQRHGPVASPHPRSDRGRGTSGLPIQVGNAPRQPPAHQQRPTRRQSVSGVLDAVAGVEGEHFLVVVQERAEVVRDDLRTAPTLGEAGTEREPTRSTTQRAPKPPTHPAEEPVIPSNCPDSATPRSAAQPGARVG
jgi:hypothetical protein